MHEYGYTVDKNEIIKPEIQSRETIPDDFPSPCNCIKCAKANVCPCRIRRIKCCEYFKCKASEACKNPIK